VSHAAEILRSHAAEQLDRGTAPGCAHEIFSPGRESKGGESSSRTTLGIRGAGGFWRSGNTRRAGTIVNGNGTGMIRDAYAHPPIESGGARDGALHSHRKTAELSD